MLKAASTAPLRALHLGICGAVVVGAAGVVLIGWQPPGTRAVPYISASFALAVLMLGGWATQRSLPDAQRWAAGWVLCAAVSARVLLLAAPTYTSHDSQRYLWDGATALTGMDPWRTAPQDARLESLRERFPTPAEHAHLPTLYPPLAVAVFAGCALFGPKAGPWIWRTLVTLASLVTLWAGYRLLQLKSRLTELPLLAFSPILLFEAGVGAHLDAFCAAALLLALWAHARGQWLHAGLWLGLGAAFKFLPAVAILPLVLIPTGGVAPGPRLMRLCSGAALAPGLSYGLALALGFVPFGTLGLFFDRWRFGSPLALLSSAPAQQLVAAFVLTGLLALAVTLSRAGRLSSGVLASLIAVLWASPVVFPWYATTVAAVIAFTPALSVIAWTLALPFTYEVMDGFDLHGSWAPARWPLWLAVAAASAGLLLDILRHLKTHPLLRKDLRSKPPSP